MKLKKKLSIFSKNDKFIYVYIYENNYSIIIKHECKDLKKIFLEINNHEVTFNKNILIRFLNQIVIYSYIKIKFTGKGYKIRKFNKSAKLMFNRAHRTILWWNNVIIKKIKKYKLYLKYVGDKKFAFKRICDVRFINFFTKRGLRISRDIVYKKKGKNK